MSRPCDELAPSHPSLPKGLARLTQAESECRMAVTSAIHVTCPQCGMRARAIKRESGRETRVTDRVTKCRHDKQGMDVVSCPALKREIQTAPKRLEG